MNRITLMVLALIAIFTISAMGQTIVGTKHDLSSGGPLTDKSSGGNATSQVCVFCHTPHQPTGVTTDPLWNHTLSSNSTYGVYSSSTMNGAPTDIGAAPANGISNLCMSCHDGTIAVNSLNNDPGSSTIDPTMGTGTELNGNFQIASGRPTMLGIDLTNDHPINFSYNAAYTGEGGATGGLVDPADPTVAKRLFAGTMQCASCHDAHNNTTAQPFLVSTTAAAVLCKECHKK